jgi:hypothetical protein
MPIAATRRTGASSPWPVVARVEDPLPVFPVEDALPVFPVDELPVVFPVDEGLLTTAAIGAVVVVGVDVDEVVVDVVGVVVGVVVVVEEVVVVAASGVTEQQGG